MENYDRDIEKRIYFVLREDIEISLDNCAIFGATATARLAYRSSQEAPERFAQYGKQTQPKICLRAKNIGQLEKAYQEARSFQSIKVHDANGEFVGVAFGPVARNEMNKALADFQIFKEFKTANVTIKMPEWNSELPSLLIGIRQDLDIPAGKLVAQSGHGAFASIDANQNVERQNILAIWRNADNLNIKISHLDDENDMKRINDISDANRIPNAYIVDAGRTVFNEPTPTVIGVGPITVEEYRDYQDGIEVKNGR